MSQGLEHEVSHHDLSDASQLACVDHIPANGLRSALHHIRTGDTLVVHSMDRLARNVEDMLKLVREMNDRGVSVDFIKENMSFTAGSEDPRSTLMFTMLSAFAQFERSLIKERQREGIALATRW